MLDQLNSRQRLILAVALSFIFFIVYDFFLVPKTPSQSVAQNQSVSLQHNQSQSVSNNHTVSPLAAPTSSRPIISTVTIGQHIWQIDSLGRIAQVTLARNGQHIALFGKEEPKPLEIRFSDANRNAQAFSTPYTASASQITVNHAATKLILTQDLATQKVTKEITFYPDGHYVISAQLSKPEEYYLAVGYRPHVAIDSYTVHGIIIHQQDDKTKTFEDEGLKGDEKIAGAKVVGGVDRYYTTTFYSDNGFNIILSPDAHKNPVAFVTSNSTLTLNGYIGAKDVEQLSNIHPLLASVVEYGFFTFIAEPLFKALAWIENHVGNWGWAIVILTIIVRIVLFPLTLKGMISMGKMKDLAPKLTDLREKYKGDPQKLNMHMLELYKKHNVNPMSGCLPLLLQIPVFFAIYRVLLNAIELQGANWILWINDLSVLDPYYVLPILMGVTMFIQQKITPQSFTDPLQQKVFMWLPVVFTIFFVAFPAGLTLYWFVNNLLSIAQQFVVNKMLDNRKIGESK